MFYLPEKNGLLIFLKQTRYRNNWWDAKSKTERQIIYPRIFFRKKMGYFHVIIDAASSNSKTFEFYYFIKDFHEEIACDRPLQTCRILNFLVPLERVFSDKEKCCEEKRNVFIKPCIKKKSTGFLFDVSAMQQKWSSIFNNSPFEGNKRIIQKRNKKI